MRKSYWITCNVEPDIQHLSLDRRRYPSSLVVRPHDLNRLLANFQSSLQEITIIATERASMASDTENEIGGKAVELRSYIDPTKGANSWFFAFLNISNRIFMLQIFNCRQRLFTAHSAVDRSSWRICPVYSQWRPCGCDIWCEGTEGLVVLVLIPKHIILVFITVVSFAQVD